MIYQNYFTADYPNFVYQKHGKTWVRRKKNSDDAWATAPFDEQMLLQHKYGDRFLGKYSIVVRLALLGLVVYGGYKGYKYIKGQSASMKSSSPM